MPSKLDILENVKMYSTDELIGYIKNGIVTFDELCNEADGCFPASARKEVEHKIARSEEEGLENSKSARSTVLTTPMIINDLLEKYSCYELAKLILNGKISFSSKDFLCSLAEDHNLVDFYFIRRLIENGYLNIEDIINAGIDKDFLSMLSNDFYPHFLSCPQTHKLPKNKVAEELYFFGLPYVGKISMLSMLLLSLRSSKDIQKMKIPYETEGASFAVCLMNVFSTSGVSKYPIRAHALVDETNYFDLNIKYCNYEKIFRFINFNENLAYLFYKRITGAIEVDTLKKESAYIDYKNNLVENRSINKKHLIFVIPYEERDIKIGNMGLQGYYDAMLYAMKEDKVFKSDIDNVSIIVTKVDRIKNKENLDSKVSNYLKNSWLLFYSHLEEICKEYLINGGKVTIIPFSCGESCFQNLVKIDFSLSNKMIKYLILDSFHQKASKRGKLFNFFNIFRR